MKTNVIAALIFCLFVCYSFMGCSQDAILDAGKPSNQSTLIFNVDTLEISTVGDSGAVWLNKELRYTDSNLVKITIEFDVFTNIESTDGAFAGEVVVTDVSELNSIFFYGCTSITEVGHKRFDIYLQDLSVFVVRLGVGIWWTYNENFQQLAFYNIKIYK